MINNIYSKRDVISYLKEKSIFPNKNRGQNFLCDRNIAFNIANTIPESLNRGDYAIEIGGGLGSLSNILIDFYRDKLTIIEYDNALYKHLINTYSNINIIHKDVLTVDINDIDNNINFDFYGNIPYNISSPIIEWLFCNCYNRWRYAVFMVQSDFANRLIAKEDTEDYSALTLFASFMSDIRLEYNVSKDVFYPIPNVTSSIISIKPKVVDLELLKVFKQVSKTLFHNRRKNIKNNFIKSPYINIDKNKIDEILEKANISALCRGETLTLKEVETLSRVLSEYI